MMIVSAILSGWIHQLRDGPRFWGALINTTKKPAISLNLVSMMTAYLQGKSFTIFFSLWRIEVTVNSAQDGSDET